MKRNWKKIVLKIIGTVLLVFLIVLFVGVYRFGKRKSDKEIIEIFQKDSTQIFIDHLTYKNKDIRVVKLQKKIDTSKLILVFTHGSPGSLLDFKKYFLDTEMNNKYNIIAYDRIGYGYFNTGEVLNSVQEETEVLEKVIQNINPQKIIAIGYSYGGTVVMASTKNFKKKIVLAAAVKANLEPDFWLLNLYKWNTTRFLIPKVLQAAAKEKLYHINNFSNMEDVWFKSKSPVLSIHGKKDRIVPYANSLFLKNKFIPKKFELFSIKNGNHALVWVNFELIKSKILNIE